MKGSTVTQRLLPSFASLRLALIAAVLGASAAQAVPVYKGAAVIGPIGPPQPPLTDSRLPKATAAAWSCQGSKCSYTKQGGAAWSDCFVSWSPTHAGWLPTRYCR
jgi:hypothetical protein